MCGKVFVCRYGMENENGFRLKKLKELNIGVFVCATTVRGLSMRLAVQRYVV